MVTSAVIVTLLTLLASLASWLFSQWLARRARASPARWCRGWRYEPAGILMTAGNDKPLPVRLGDGGPMVAPIFTIRDAAGVRRQIRYLACEVTAPGVLRLLRGFTEQLTSQRLTAELRADACYSQVVDWSRSGHRPGASPDALLRQGIH